jgi:hypothetical protein
MIYAPLEAIIVEGSNKDANSGASLCLYQFFGALAQGNKPDVIDVLAPKFASLFYVFYVVCMHFP